MGDLRNSCAGIDRNCLRYVYHGDDRVKEIEVTVTKLEPENFMEHININCRDCVFYNTEDCKTKTEQWREEWFKREA